MGQLVVRWVVAGALTMGGLGSGHAQVAVGRVGHARGPDTAAVTVVEFMDFGCEACAWFAAHVFPALHDDYVATGRVRWVVVPFVLGPFRHAREAAAVGWCAAAQGHFWPVHDRLLARQAEWGARGPAEATPALLAGLSADAAALQSCLGADETRSALREADRLARRHRVRGTPTFFVNERRVRGALPVEAFRAVLDDALARP
ncbi:MAG: thioredoxin domain-containing protein [Gemmatimonadales bacterium]